MRIELLLGALLVVGGSMAFGAEFAVVDEVEFAKVAPVDAKVERVATGFKFVEGPVWFDDGHGDGDAGGYLLFSDIPADVMFKWTVAGGATEWRKPSWASNGNTKDLRGRLVTCEQSTRRVTVTEADGTVTPIVDSFDGKKFNSPNDAVVKSDGTVWFTDPPYGVPKGARREIETQNVFRHDPKTGKTTAVVTDMRMPNGLAFSPDERVLYVAESQWDGPKDVRAFDVNADGTLSNGRVFCALDRSRKDGVPDGMRVDTDGRLWSSAADGVQIFTPAGRRIGTILVPETVSNLTFGGSDGKTLFMTASKSVYRVPTRVTGATGR